MFLDFTPSKRFLVAKNDKTEEKNFDGPISMLDIRTALNNHFIQINEQA